MAENQVDTFRTQVRHLSLMQNYDQTVATLPSSYQVCRQEPDKRAFCHITFHDGSDRMIYQWFIIDGTKVKMSAICFSTTKWSIVCKSITIEISHPSEVGRHYYTSPPCWSSGGDMVILDSGRTHEDPQQKSRLYVWIIEDEGYDPAYLSPLKFIPTITKPSIPDSVNGSEHGDGGILYHVTGFRFSNEITGQALTSEILVSGYKCFPPDDRHMIIDSFQITEGDVQFVRRVDKKGYTFFPVRRLLMTMDNEWRVHFWPSGHARSDEIVAHSMNSNSQEVDLKYSYVHKDYYPVEIVPSPDENMVAILQVHTDVVRLILFRLSYEEKSTKILKLLATEPKPARNPNIGYGGPFRYMVAFTSDSDVVAASCQNDGRILVFAIRGDDVQPVCLDSFDKTTLDKPVCGVWCSACLSTNFAFRDQGKPAKEMKCFIHLDKLAEALPDEISDLVSSKPTVCNFRNGPLKEITTLKIEF